MPKHQQNNRQLTFADLTPNPAGETMPPAQSVASVTAALSRQPDLPASPGVESYLATRRAFYSPMSECLNLAGIAGRHELRTFLGALTNGRSHKGALLAALGDALASCAPTMQMNDEIAALGRFLSQEINSSVRMMNKRLSREGRLLEEQVRRLEPTLEDCASAYGRYLEALAAAVKSLRPGEQVRAGRFQSKEYQGQCECVFPADHPLIQAVEGLRAAVLLRSAVPCIDDDQRLAECPLRVSTKYGYDKLHLANCVLEGFLPNGEERSGRR